MPPKNPCYGKLDHIKTQDTYIIKYQPIVVTKKTSFSLTTNLNEVVKKDSELHDHEKLKLDTLSLFINKDPKNCPIHYCVLREDDCKTKLPPHMAEMADEFPF